MAERRSELRLAGGSEEGDKRLQEGQHRSTKLLTKLLATTLGNLG